MQVSDYIVKKYGRLDMPIQDMITGKDPGEVPIQDLVSVILGTGSKKESVFSISERIKRMGIIHTIRREGYDTSKRI